MEYICGGYDRLSDADSKTDESSSIQSQKIIIDSFAKFNNLKIYKHYIDDGYSGGNFDRPAFQEMIKDIEAGKINCVITKDLSRLGREMYKTGKYIEEYFLEKGVRYIAINDSYDSNIGDSMLGIRLSVNDLYLRDVSKKVKTSLRAKQNRGDYIGSFPLYGYKKDPNDKHKLIIDEEVRHIVELIYDLALEGKSPNKIAEHLTYKKVDSLPELPTDEDAEKELKNIIFLIEKENPVDENIYDEYMFIDGAFEKIGALGTGNLDDYVTKLTFDTKVGEFQNQLDEISREVGTFSTQLTEFQSLADEKFVLKTDFNTFTTKVGNFNALLSATGKQQTTIIDEIIEIENQIQWQPISDEII